MLGAAGGLTVDGFDTGDMLPPHSDLGASAMDRWSHSASVSALSSWVGNGGVTVVRGDICDLELLDRAWPVVFQQP